MLPLLGQSWAQSLPRSGQKNPTIKQANSGENSHSTFGHNNALSTWVQQVPPTLTMISILWNIQD